MRAYSTDFRHQVVQAYEAGRGAQRHLARLLSVSLSLVQELPQRSRQTGSVEPKPHGGGNAGKVLKHLAEVERFHLQQPAAALAERGEKLAEAVQVRVSRRTMSRALTRWELTRKKRRAVLLSKARPQANKRGPRTGRRSRALAGNR